MAAQVFYSEPPAVKVSTINSSSMRVGSQLFCGCLNCLLQGAGGPEPDCSVVGDFVGHVSPVSVPSGAKKKPEKGEQAGFSLVCWRLQPVMRQGCAATGLRVGDKSIVSKANPSKGEIRRQAADGSQGRDKQQRRLRERLFVFRLPHNQLPPSMSMLRRVAEWCLLQFAGCHFKR
ncbi:hypothetical protein N657DRAFT_646445 [Parathielavia appendiculata]|uniref:Uncharacterized protein n=1 Tax=Parathielavia appendiculata TaxID=2587402 RepID=A0AAN6TXU4_9PEZI|nr:hypothetical protein N657DRAFT_646445 [Parathielavia appendiculata]